MGKLYLLSGIYKKILPPNSNEQLVKYSKLKKIPTDDETVNRKILMMYAITKKIIPDGIKFMPQFYMQAIYV